MYMSLLITFIEIDHGVPTAEFSHLFAENSAVDTRGSPQNDEGRP
jgi:hypothetical protein